MDAISGRRILDIERRAKYLLIMLEDGLTWLAHLGMTGRFGHQLEGKHDHVVVDFEDGTRLVYTDPRRFGMMDLIRPGESHKLLEHLGPEPWVIIGVELNFTNLSEIETFPSNLHCSISTSSLDLETFTQVKFCFAPEYLQSDLQRTSLL